MGHEFVVAMRQFTPPPPPPPGDPPAVLPPRPEAAPTLMFRPSNGTEGGTVVTWKSLDHGGPMTILLEEDLHEDWPNVPFFSKRYGDYYFFIWHPVQAVAPPDENPPLGTRDAAMMEQLETSFPDMNLLVAQSAAAARNAPEPAPVAPGAKRFWRISADWGGVDTDGDGSPDWAEFEMMADSNHPSHDLADPFNADTDGNGVADGNQLDADIDGTPDGLDIAVGDAVVTQPVVATPRYAIFPVTTAQPPPAGRQSPLQINDRGTVLYENGTWSGGIWTPLNPDGTKLKECRARGINDGGEIIGWGSYELQADPEVRGSLMARWSGPTAVPAIVGTDDRYATTYGDFEFGNLAPGPVISNDGRVIAPTCKIEVPEGLTLPALVAVNPATRSLWTLPGPGRAAGEIVVGGGMLHVLNEDCYWGFNPANNEGLVVGPGNPGELDWIPVNLVPSGAGSLTAFHATRSPRIFEGGAWKGSISLLNGLDMSSDGTVIAANFGGMTAPVMLNGKWVPLKVAAPDAPAHWHGGTAGLLDTTPGGWILAKQGAGEAESYAALLPLRVQGNLTVDGTLVRRAVGVDDFSITSSAPGPAVRDKIWIMAPTHGGETKVKLSTPIHSSCPLELSGEDLLFNGNATLSITGPETEFTLKAADTIASGTEIPLVLKVGTGATLQSVSTPIAAKVMKRRTIRVRVWKVKADDGDMPAFDPTKAQLEAYPDKVFQPQINAVFDCNIETIGPFGYDTATGTDFGAPEAHDGLVQAGNKALNFTGDFKGEMSNIRAGGNYVSTFNINLYIVGGAVMLDATGWNAEKNKFDVLHAAGAAHNSAGPNGTNTPRECWIAGEAATLDERLRTVAHEIGHILFGFGRPERNGGPAPLPGTPWPPRLMCGNPKLVAIGGLSRLIVKGEWDEAKEWFDDEIKEGRMPQ